MTRSGESLAERLARSRARVVPPKPAPPATPPEAPPPDPVGESSGDGGESRRARLERARRLLRRVEARWDRKPREDDQSPSPVPARPGPRRPPAVRRPPGEPFTREDHDFPMASDFARGALSRLPEVRPQLAARLNLRPDEPGVDLSRAIFLDTETSGLAGGTGTFAFLIGAGWVEDGRFRIAQFLLRDPAGERAMLEAFAALAVRHLDLVTYNGKSFDMPLLETRFALNGLSAPLGEARHLDLLHPARRLFHPVHGSAKLGVLERVALGVERDDDIAGALIPQVFFDFLRGGADRRMESVLSHNRYDLRTLAALTVHAAERLDDDWDDDDPAAIHGVGDHRWRRNEPERAIPLIERALAAGLGGTLRDRSLLQLGEHAKRGGDWDAARVLWRRVSDDDTPERLEALVWFAKHEEHQRKDFDQALLHVEDALERLPRLPLRPDRARTVREALQHRRRRLRRRARS